MQFTTDYKALIRNVRDYYLSKPCELRNIRNGDEIFDLVWCDGLEEEINLWTYWQGAGVDAPEVMIVGQDFGSCNDLENKDFFKRCVQCSVDDREKISKEYIERINADKQNKTDNMLIRLTEEGLGSKYSARIPRNGNLFLTNLCLGYRLGNKISGGNIAAYLKHDSAYILKLIQIKKPKVVICLGLDTYSNLLSAFIADKDIYKEICLHFWKELDCGTNFRDISFGECYFRLYGVSHAGSNGAMNRKKNYSQNNEEYSGEELMIMDWKRIGTYLK